LFAPFAFSASNDGSHYHSVANFDVGHAVSDLFDHTSTFVSKDVTFLQLKRLSLVEVQVGSAHGSARHFDQRIFRLGNVWNFVILDSDVVLAMPD